LVRLNKIKKNFTADYKTNYTICTVKLTEYQTKKLLKAENISIPKGGLCSDYNDVGSICEDLKAPFFIKAQINSYNRKASNGILEAKTVKAAENITEEMIGSIIKEYIVKDVLIEEAIEVEQEFYLGFYLDQNIKKNILLFYPKGGADLDTNIQESPEDVLKIELDSILGVQEKDIDEICAEIPILNKNKESFSKIILDLFKVYIQFDGSQMEMNPLAIGKDNNFYVLDVKFEVDDNALFRQKELVAFKSVNSLDVIEEKARGLGISYVRLSGNIGIIGNGSGLVLSTMDEVLLAGGKPANFLDIGTGPSKDVVKNALDLLLLDSNIKGILINVFGSITECDEVAKGIIGACQERRVARPIVVRLEGNKAKDGSRILANSTLLSALSFKDSVRKVVEIVKALE
jgi:succinyl-CoA synthetase beta subunit